MKLRKLQIFGFLVMAAAIVGLLQFKFAIEGKEQQVAEINRQYVEDERAIRVLRAEWAYLNSPQSLQQLTQRFLHLQPITADKILANYQVVPIRAGSAPERLLTPLTSTADTSDLRPREKPAWAYTLGENSTADNTPAPRRYAGAGLNRQQ